MRVYLTSVFLLLSVPRCFGDQKPQFDSSYLLWDLNKRKTFDTSSCLFDENNTGIDSLLKIYGDNTRKRPTYTEIKYKDINMKDFTDMNSNFQARQHQLPIFKYENRKPISDADTNAPLEQDDTPAPSPPLMPHQTQIPPHPTFNIPAIPSVIATEEPPPIPSPKEKEKEEEEQSNIILLPVNNQSPPLQSILKPTYKRKPLGEGVYWKQPANDQDQGLITTSNETGKSVKQSIQIRNCKDTRDLVHCCTMCSIQQMPHQQA